MSAESPHKSSSRGGHVVTPQPVSDRSIIESVAGFINEVVPQAYTSLPTSDSKECITWARFEYGDINDPALYPDTADERSSTPPLLLVLGYGSGVQVWAVPANGEASEVLSWRQGVVRTLRILPTPLSDSPVPDAYSHKRPLVALCDSAGPGPQFCSLSFISLRGGDQVKSIKFKNPINDVLANRRSIVVTFPERIAVFDACTLEDRLTVTTCYPCPGPNPNPVALGTRWLAYSERRLLPARRSSGGTEGEGVQSYTAAVLHAAKSLGKGLRELGESVASSLTQRGVGVVSGATSGAAGCDGLQPGMVTIVDAQGADECRTSDASSADGMVAHFMAHSEPVVALAFDPSGMLLLTADKRGHDFHLFRVQPHPGGPSLAAVHHLYILHRGDTTAKVQDIAFAADSRWVAVSTLRGTTHVFPITPYGGPVGLRTHTTPHVVNRLSRFHRSAGLTADGRNSPVPCACPSPSHETAPYPNPRLPPYPHPAVVAPLAQIRQPAPAPPGGAVQPSYHRNPSARPLGRSQSLGDDGTPGGAVPLRLAACFGPPRAWLVGSPTVPRDSSVKARKRAVDSLFVMACHGSLIEYDLEPRHSAGIPKEKVCDDTPIELEVQAKAQWMLLRPPHSNELQPPLPSSNPLMALPDRLPPASESRADDADERWLSQVEIVTHAGPHRRLWMGPQFTFKTYNAPAGTPVSLLEVEAVEVGTGGGSRPARSNPVNMPLTGGGRPIVPVLIESGSASSYEQSPRLLEVYGGEGDSDGSAGPGDTQLREDLADAMLESPGVPIRDTGGRVIVTVCGKRSSLPVEKVVNPVGTVITVPDLGAPPSPVAGRREDVEAVVKWPTAVKSSQWAGSNLLDLNNTADSVVRDDNESKCSKGVKLRAKQDNEKDLGRFSAPEVKSEKKRKAHLASAVLVIDSESSAVHEDIQILNLDTISNRCSEEPLKSKPARVSNIDQKKEEVIGYHQKNGEKKKRTRKKVCEDSPVELASVEEVGVDRRKSKEKLLEDPASIVDLAEDLKEGRNETSTIGMERSKKKLLEDTLVLASMNDPSTDTRKNKFDASAVVMDRSKKKLQEDSVSGTDSRKSRTESSSIGMDKNKKKLQEEPAPVERSRTDLRKDIVEASVDKSKEKLLEDALVTASFDDEQSSDMRKDEGKKALVYQEEETELENFVLSMVTKKGRDVIALGTKRDDDATEGEPQPRAKSRKNVKKTRTSPGKEEVGEDVKEGALCLPPLKSWSSIVSQKPSEEPDKVWSASSLDPEVISSTVDFPALGSPPGPAPQRSWSGVVSTSPKDEGSGGYDSNESKESTDPDPDPEPEAEAATITELVDATAGEEEPASTKKSRRAKKKRR